MSGGAAAIGMLAGAQRSAPTDRASTPQAGDVILYSSAPAAAAIVGVIRPLTETEATALTAGAAAVWTTSFNGSADIQYVLVGDVLALVPFQ